MKDKPSSKPSDSSKNEKDKEKGLTQIINLDKLLKLDSCFRCPNPHNCTLKAILQKFKDDPNVNSISRSTFYKDLEEFRKLGAKFKGKELHTDDADNRDKQHSFSYAKDGHTAYYQYEDINAPLPALQEIVGTLRKDSGTALLAALEKESDDNMATSVHVWLRLFLEQMLKGHESSLQTVSFYDNLHLNSDNLKTFETALRALLNKTPLKIHYVKKNGDHTDASIIPYRLKNYNQRWFLIAKCWNPTPSPECPNKFFDGYYVYPLDGIKPLLSRYGEELIPAIQKWDFEYIDPDDDIDEYFNEIVGVTASPDGPKDVYLSFTPERFPYVASKPISSAQFNKPVPENDTEHYRPGRITIKLRVHINRELVQQILSFGTDCEVVAPQELRTSIAEKVKAMSALYSV